MADHFEEAKDDILFRTQGNGGPTPRDLLTAMGALAKDVDEAISGLDKKQHQRHMETVGEMKAICARVTEAEDWQKDWETACPTKLEEAIERGVVEAVEMSEAAHENRHNTYVQQLEQSKRRAGDPKDDDWTPQRSNLSSEADKQVWFMWMVGSKLGYILIAVIITVINIVLNMLWFGTP